MAAATTKTPKPMILKPIQRMHVTCVLVGIRALVQHAWDEKAREMMRQKQQEGVKTKNRDLRDPAAEAEAACYKTVDGKYGIYIMAIKKAIILSAHKDLGIDRTLVRKALFIVCDDPNLVVPFLDQKTKYRVEEDMVRVGQGTAALRYRPYWDNWSVRVTFELDTALLQTKAFLTLVDWAGSRQGIGEMRPEKDGEYGRFKIDMTQKIIEKKV